MTSSVLSGIGLWFIVAAIVGLLFVIGYWLGGRSATPAKPAARRSDDSAKTSADGITEGDTSNADLTDVSDRSSDADAVLALAGDEAAATDAETTTSSTSRWGNATQPAGTSAPAETEGPKAPVKKTLSPQARLHTTAASPMMERRPATTSGDHDARRASFTVSDQPLDAIRKACEAQLASEDFSIDWIGERSGMLTRQDGAVGLVTIYDRGIADEVEIVVSSS